jgi:nucleotide-binding universal stress UspA family protein
MRSSDIVVGVDGSVASWDALYWAASEAERSHAALRVVTVNFTSWPDDMSATSGTPVPSGERSLGARLARMISETKLLVPTVPVTGHLLRGVVTPALCEFSLHSRLLVLGNRGHGGFGRLSVGSTGHQAATHAAVPVVVVRGHPGTADSPIVVGVDGSVGADHALSAAFEECGLRRCPLIAVFAYGQPKNPWAYHTDQPGPDPRLTHALAYGSLDTALAPWREKYPQVNAEIATTGAEATTVLADLSQHAQLVVVGSHGHGDSAGLLGSVPLKLLHRSHCPVMVVR